MAEKSTKSKRGGKRPGAGRPRTRAVRALLSKRLISELETLGDDLLPAVRELIRGVQVQQYNRKGEAIVYSQPPNAQMIIYVIDRLLGRMPSRTVIGGEPDGEGNERPIPIRLLPPE